MKIFNTLRVLLLCFLFLPDLALSQDRSVLEEFTNNDSKFSFHMNNNNKDSALYFLKKNEAIAEKTKSERLLSITYLNRAEFFKLTNSDITEMIRYTRMAYSYFSKAGIVKEETDCAYLFAEYFSTIAQYDSIFYYCNKYIPICKKNGFTKNAGILTILKGRALISRGDNAGAAQLFREAISFVERSGDTLNLFQMYVSMASAYSESNYRFALEFLNKASQLGKRLSPYSLGSLYTLYGNVYNNSGNYDSALYFYNKNLAILDKNDDKIQYGAMVGNIGNIYLAMKRYDEALKYQFESLNYFTQAYDSLDIEIAFGSIADIYLAKADYGNSLKYYKTALSISLRLGLLEEIIYNYKGLYGCYEKTGKYKEAHEAFKNYDLYKDSIQSAESAKKLTEQEMTYKFENQKKEEALIQRTKDIITEEKLKAQKITIYATVFGGIVLVGFLFFSVKNSNARKRMNQKLVLSNTEIEHQKSIIETKNREITDSITYAARLQQGILPDMDDVKRLLPGSFIFYRPRDIVSGDFYWMKQLDSSSLDQKRVAIAVADCTGHGVPGAFMSFIGSTILNQTIGNDKVRTPADALNYLNRQLPLTLQSKQKTGQIYDGMEAGICVIDRTKDKLFYSGANLNLIHIRKNSITEIKGDKHSIGLNIEQQKNFNNHEVTLEKGDCLYLFSDGYPDQFGGPKGKKFKYKNLLELLNSISHLPVDEQYPQLSDNFDNWKGDLEQLDDVLLFGMKV